MDPNAQPPTQTQVSPPEGSKSNALLALISVFILLGVVGITLWLYIQNKQSSNKIPVDQATKKSDENKATTLTNDPNDVKEINGMKVAGAQNQALIAKYGVICKRFTSLDEALVTPEIACILDLSDQNLSEIPENILKLTHLNELNLSDNKFTEFPEILFQSKTLLSVNLENNNLATMPDDIKSKIPTLQSVKLKGNNLSEEVIEKHQRLISSPLPTQP